MLKKRTTIALEHPNDRYQRLRLEALQRNEYAKPIVIAEVDDEARARATAARDAVRRAELARAGYSSEREATDALVAALNDILERLASDDPFSIPTAQAHRALERVEKMRNAAR